MHGVMGGPSVGGRREAALDPIEEAVEIHRALAEANPDAFRPGLALSLTNLSVCLAELGREAEAAAAGREAASIGLLTG